ncbi:YigZ family protein [Halioxenophilus aromaticivorans]|uniref:IMPACT family protein n=1 Tax=Halioxenophilus aromaticivorans TaxID=1306992 RepID=A0AAV3U092_9ALTE
MEEYSVPAQPCSAELEIKRSRFIAYLQPASDRSQALAALQTVREQHPQARHVCWAYIAGSPTTTVRSMSDDGEPSGTAGRPMLAVLEHSGLGEVIVAVVRYFGGIKLGMGGLQRAYSDAVSLVLADCTVQTRLQLAAAVIRCGFAHEAQVRHLVEQLGGVVEGAQYAAGVTLPVLVPAAEKTVFTRDLASISSGAAICDWQR